MGNLRLISMMHTPWRTDAFLYDRYLDLEGKNSQLYLFALPTCHEGDSYCIYLQFVQC